MRVIVLGDYDASACFFIETMHDARPLFPADPRKRGAMIEQSIDQRVLAMTSARMNNEAGRLVNDNEIAVLEKNIQRNRFRSIVDLFGGRLAEINFIVFADEVARPGGCSVEGHESISNQLLEPRARISC